MPVEKSGQNEFDFQYGDDFGAHIEKFDPDCLEGPRPLQPRRRRRDERAPARAAQAARRLAARERPQVPLRAAGARRPTTQLASVGGDTDRYDAELRPELMRRAIEETQDFGMRGRHLEDRGRRRPRGRRDARRADPRGRGPRGRRLRRCSAAAPATRRSTTGCARPRRVEGFIGFAIGRSIWWDALKGFLDGALEREAAAAQIAENYLRFIRVYEEQETAVA